MVKRVVFCIYSDHIPIVLSTSQFNSGPKLFRFFNMWCKGLDLQDLVSSTWREMESPSLSTWDKFKQLRVKVKSWQATRFSSVVSRSRKCESEMVNLFRSPSSSNAEEIKSFSLRKRELDLKLKHLRTIEDQY